MMKLIARMLTAALAAAQVAFFSGAYAADKPYVVLSEDLQKLKDDFNAKVGTVRLLFIIGPTCGICLRGMADLNDEFLAEYQSDPRLNTFAVHVPVLQAQEKHVAPAMQLMTGPRIYHYWDAVGKIGLLYQDVLDTEVYVWDVWFVYGPEAVWDGVTPPAPDYWEHQLPSALPGEKKLDKKRFAREVLARVNALSLDDFDATAVAANDNPLADGAVIPSVGQGFGTAIKSYRDAQGGAEAIRAIQKREYRGDLIIADERYDLLIIEERPNKIEKHVSDADYMLRYDGANAVERHGHLPREGMPLKVEAHLMGFFDFDTPLIDWSKKGHKFSMEGMEKHGQALSWKLVQTDPDGRKWTYLINSHSGLIERIQAYDDEGALMVSVYYSDYENVDGTPVAHRVEYRSPVGELWAVERFASVHIFRTEEQSAE